MSASTQSRLMPHRRIFATTFHKKLSHIGSEHFISENVGAVEKTKRAGQPTALNLTHHMLFWDTSLQVRHVANSAPRHLLPPCQTTFRPTSAVIMLVVSTLRTTYCRYGHSERSQQKLSGDTASSQIWRTSPPYALGSRLPSACSLRSFYEV